MHEKNLWLYTSLVRLVRVVRPYLDGVCTRYKIPLPLPYHSYHLASTGKDLAMPYRFPCHFFKHLVRNFRIWASFGDHSSLPLLPLLVYKATKLSPVMKT